MAWRIVREGQRVSPPGGAYATAWSWELASDEGSERRTVLVKISGTSVTSTSAHASWCAKALNVVLGQESDDLIRDRVELLG